MSDISSACSTSLPALFLCLCVLCPAASAHCVSSGVHTHCAPTAERDPGFAPIVHGLSVPKRFGYSQVHIILLDPILWIHTALWSQKVYNVVCGRRRQEKKTGPGFTPDFTSSRVIRELKLVTFGGSEFVFVLNASLPYHMLATCAETLPRPSWELELYIIVSLIMSSMFLLVIATAWIEAKSIWEPFKRRVSVESNNLETGKRFNLSEIVHNLSNSHSLELPYTTPLEKERKNLQSKSLHPLPTLPKPRPLAKNRQDGKSEEGRSSLLSKMLSSGSVPELGHSSSSEGEKEFTSPEWDMPEHSSQNCIFIRSRSRRSTQTLSSKEPTVTPPPTSPLLSRGSYSSVLNSDSLKKAPGSKLPAAPPLPGKNGNPTFAAVAAAGYDKSPGGSGPGKGLSHMTSVESDSSDSSGLWSPIDSLNSPNIHSNSFSAFGPNNNFNLTGVFNVMNPPKSSEPQQQTWTDFTPVSSTIWDVPTSDPLHSWPSSSGSPTASTASLLGSVPNPWSNTWSSSIWSTGGADSALNPFPSPSGPGVVSGSSPPPR
ncbi:hypothetical protein WMY93_024715 [Mugilogobius chulae]|uniref:Transmembrane protein 131 n=1 Tax=Mugilogobius chulae TaxID=88201 RepID=A0AAW0N575_9GOBI